MTSAPIKAVLSAAILGLAACSTPQDAAGVATRSNAAKPIQPVPVEVSQEQRWKEARAAQLQTPLELPPQATGAPPPDHLYAAGIDVGAAELIAGGVDITPNVRVWQRWSTGSRQIYGPPLDAISPLSTPVRIAPQ